MATCSVVCVLRSPRTRYRGRPRTLCMMYGEAWDFGDKSMSWGKEKKYDLE